MMLFTKTTLKNILRLLVIGAAAYLCTSKEEEKETTKFLDACAHGLVKDVAEFLEKDPSYATLASDDGETCLHLTAVSGNLEVVKMVVEGGANVNQRTTFDKGQRMTPLSWHVWGGHVNIVEYLLDKGAEINTDFDISPDARVTVLDVAEVLISGNDPSKEPDNQLKTHRLLVERGAKRFADIYPDSPYIWKKEESKGTKEEEALYDL